MKSRFLNLVLLGVALVWVLVRSGTGVYPALEWYLPIVVQWPVRSSAEFESYLSDSPIGIIAAQSLGATNESGFLLLSLIVVISSLLALAVWTALLTGSQEKWRAARLAILAPIGGVVLTWVGSYDAFTLAIWVLVLFAWSYGNRPVLILSGVLLGFQHSEVALLGVIILTAIWLAVKTDLPSQLSRENPAWLLIGVTAGRVLLEIVFRINQQSGNGRSEWVLRFLVEWNKTGINIAPQLLWSLFAGFWVVVILLILVHWNQRYVFLFGISILIGIIALIVSGDRPRVFILVFFPALLLMTIAFLRNNRITIREKRLAEVIIWLAPPLIFWGKEVANSNVIDLGTVLIQKL